MKNPFPVLAKHKIKKLLVCVNRYKKKHEQIREMQTIHLAEYILNKIVAENPPNVIPKNNNDPNNPNSEFDTSNLLFKTAVAAGIAP